MLSTHQQQASSVPEGDVEVGGGSPVPPLSMSDHGDSSLPAGTAATAPCEPGASQDGNDELTSLKREEEMARRNLLAQRKASLQQRQQAARSSSSGTATPSGSTVARDGGEQQTETKAPSNLKKKEQVVRAEAVENAVRFLNHPKVKESPLGKRLAFLEHKGLNDSEIALALKRANISSDDVKLAMDLANSASSSSSSPSSSSPSPHEGNMVGASSPPLPPRATSMQPQPPPMHQPGTAWGWGVRVAGALAFFALGGVTSFLAAKHYFSDSLDPSGDPTTSTSSSTSKAGREERGDGQLKLSQEQQDATDRLKVELEVLRASQEALAVQVREAFVAMKESMESQRQTSLSGTSREEEVPSSKAPAKTAAHEDETIASLKTEIKTLRAMLLDTRTAESAATRASTLADLPSLSIASASSPSASPSPPTAAALPSWQMASKRSTVSQPSSSPSTSSSTLPATPSANKPSAPKPYERRAAAMKVDSPTATASSTPLSTGTGSASAALDETGPTESQSTSTPASAEETTPGEHLLPREEEKEAVSSS